MPTSKAKEAYLRRHNLKSRTSVATDQASAVERAKNDSLEPSIMAKPEQRRSPSGDDVSIRAVPALVPASPPQVSFSDMSWSQKRKMHIEARASGQSQRVSVDETPAPAPLPKPINCEGEKTWRERRKEAFLATHNAKVKQEAVATKVVMFAALLRQRSKQTSETGQSPREATETADIVPDLSHVAALHAARSQHPEKEKTWKQKRKESYLARHTSRPQTQNAHVAVRAVQFAVKLDKLRRESKAKHKQGGASAASAPIKMD